MRKLFYEAERAKLRFLSAVLFSPEVAMESARRTRNLPKKQQSLGRLVPWNKTEAISLGNQLIQEIERQRTCASEEKESATEQRHKIHGQRKKLRSLLIDSRILTASNVRTLALDLHQEAMDKIAQGTITEQELLHSQIGMPGTQAGYYKMYWNAVKKRWQEYS